MNDLTVATALFDNIRDTVKNYDYSRSVKTEMFVMETSAAKMIRAAQIANGIPVPYLCLKRTVKNKEVIDKHLVLGKYTAHEVSEMLDGYIWKTFTGVSVNDTGLDRIVLKTFKILPVRKYTTHYLHRLYELYYASHDCERITAAKLLGLESIPNAVIKYNIDSDEDLWYFAFYLLTRKNGFPYGYQILESWDEIKKPERLKGFGIGDESYIFSIVQEAIVKRIKEDFDISVIAE